jgi:hypothetical protein
LLNVDALQYTFPVNQSHHHKFRRFLTLISKNNWELCKQQQYLVFNLRIQASTEASILQTFFIFMENFVCTYVHMSKNAHFSQKVLAPGADPTKHNFPNFTHICKIFLKICVKFLTNLWKNEYYLIFRNTSKPNFDYFTSILKKNGSKWLQNNLSYQTILIKSNKNVKMSKLQIFVITNMRKSIFVTFGRTGSRSYIWKDECIKLFSETTYCIIRKL